MADTFRIRGSDCQVRLTRDSVLQRTIIDIKEASITIKINKILERYLGRSSMSTDDQYSHTEGSIKFNPRSQDALLLARDIKKRAQRQVALASMKINFVATLQFPDGKRPQIIVPDLSFGDIPLTLSAEAYVEQGFEWVAEDYDVLAV